MKLVSIVVPTYNEEENIIRIINRIESVFNKELRNKYEYEIVFIDNYSTDKTKEIIEREAKEKYYIKGIFNAKNFGFNRSTFYGLSQAKGDCAVLIFADMQDPPELINEFLQEWENGNKIVVGIKNKSKENILMYKIREGYYQFIKKIGEIEHIEQYTGFGLYDSSFIKILKELEDPLPYLRGIVAELGFAHKKVFYEQEKRKYGKTSFNFMRLYDTAMLGITSYSKVITRMATICGFVISILSLCIAIITLFIKIIYWERFSVGIAAISIGVYLLGALNLFFIGIVGEYIVNINIRTMKHPLVIEEKRINY